MLQAFGYLLLLPSLARTSNCHIHTNGMEATAQTLALLLSPQTVLSNNSFISLIGKGLGVESLMVEP